MKDPSKELLVKDPSMEFLLKRDPPPMTLLQAWDISRMIAGLSWYCTVLAGPGGVSTMAQGITPLEHALMVH